MHTRYYFILLISFFVSSVFAQEPSKNTNEKYLTQINGHEEFVSIQGEPLTRKYGQVAAVEIVLDIRDDKLYFINSNRYLFHYRFCKKVLGATNDVIAFNKHNYSQSKDRKFILATLNYFKRLNLFALEFSSLDELTFSQIENFYKMLQSNFHVDADLKLLINTPLLAAKFYNKTSIVDQIDASELYTHQIYQPVNTSESYGYLKMVRSGEEENFGQCDCNILVTTGATGYLPRSGGVITTDFQSPVSQFSRLAKNRGSAAFAYRYALNDPTIDSLLGTLVYLKVELDTFLIRPAHLGEAKSFWQKHKPTKTYTLNPDFSKSGLLEISQVNMSDYQTVGTKAANFAEFSKVVCEEVPINLPEKSFVIPFHYYKQHLERYDFDGMIYEICENPEIYKKRQILKQELKRLRDAIKIAPLSPQLVDLIKEKLGNNKGERFRFRSSSNTEAVEGFNNTGLYKSKTVVIGDKDKSIEEGVKDVWASLWTLKAFEERQYFNIDQQSVAMGILAHSSFPDEYANGVAITSNPYRNDANGFLINCQLGEESVTKPATNVTCEQFISYMSYNTEAATSKSAVDYISYSSLNKNRTILSQEQITILTTQLEAVKQHFFNLTQKDSKDNYLNYALDVEFKFIPDANGNSLYIKQVRPFSKSSNNFLILRLNEESE